MNKKMYIYNVSLIVTIMIGICLFINNIELKAKNSNLEIEKCSIEMKSHDFMVERDAYKMLYTSQESDIENYKALYKEEKQNLENLKTQIYLSKEKEKKISRGDFQNKDLSQFSMMTIDEMNDWISKRAPKDSPFIGQGEIFLKAGMKNNIDPKVIIAISATESGWGKSSLAVNKGNYFGITAYNDSPFDSAKSFNGDFDSKIYNSVSWIKENFYNKGKISLMDMQSGKDKAYSQNNDGTPNEDWIKQITCIVYSGNNIIT